MSGEPTWFEAYDAVLTPLLAPSALADLLAGADASGALQGLVEPAAVADVAGATGLPVERAQSLLDVLELHDVVERDADRFRLAPAWRALVGPGGFATLGDTLRAARIEGRLLRSAAGGTDYWTIPAEDRVVLARATSPNPFDAGMVEGFRAMLADSPDHRDLADGGILLELGCGVAGRLLTMLQALPRMRAVGVELAPDLADEARRRAEALGVADRFEVVCGDATTFDRPAAFDAVFWSQFFFPADTRADALRTAYASLRSGGRLEAPLLGGYRAVVDDPRGVEARGLALYGFLLASWGIPLRTREELVDEVAAAGFVDVGSTAGDGPLRIFARKP